MDTKSIAEIIELGKKVEAAGNLKKEINNLTQEKSQLVRSINLLRKTQVDEKAKYEKDKEIRNKEIKELETVIKGLTAKRVNLASSTIPEIDKLGKIKEENSKVVVKLEKLRESQAIESTKQSKENSKIEEKKNIISQIKSLAEKL